MPHEPGSALYKFVKRIKAGENGCIEWTGARNVFGYSIFRFRLKTRSGHKWLYDRLFGKTPKGLELDHLCRNRACVNPIHLERVTHLENMRRAAPLRRRTHCPQDHLLEGDNLFFQKDGRRRCRICRNATAMRHYYAKRGRPMPAVSGG